MIRVSICKIQYSLRVMHLLCPLYRILFIKYIEYFVIWGSHWQIFVYYVICLFSLLIQFFCTYTSIFFYINVQLQYQNIKSLYYQATSLLSHMQLTHSNIFRNLHRRHIQRSKLPVCFCKNNFSFSKFIIRHKKMMKYEIKQTFSLEQ